MKIEVKQNKDKYNGIYNLVLVAIEFIKKDTLVFKIKDYESSNKPTRYTIQVAKNKHITEHTIISNLNHSCDPNVRIETDLLSIFSNRDINPGEELTFFYPSTEWEMKEPFKCQCNSKKCLDYIAGAKFLPFEVLDSYFLNKHIRLLILNVN